MEHYWFDTDCFSDFIYGELDENISSEIIEKTTNKKAVILISPFVFYEIIKGKDKLTDIKELYDRLMKLPSFYIANYLNVFDMPNNFTDGKSTIQTMKMGEVLGDKSIEYAWFRDGYKKQLGVPYSNYIIQYCKMAAITYLVSKECNEKGKISLRTENKIKRIERFDTVGNNKTNFEEMFSNFFIRYNYRTIGERTINDNHLMQEQMLVFVNILLNSSETAIQLIEEGIPYSKDIFNERLIKNEKIASISLLKYHSALDILSKKTNGSLTPKLVFEKYIKNKIQDIYYSRLFEYFVCKRIFYKNLNNDFIDFINIYCAGTFLSNGSNHFFTYDSHWNDFLESHKQDNLFQGGVLLYHPIERRAAL